MRPFIVSSTPRASSALSSTTVLAQDSDSPNTSAPPHSHPHNFASSVPSSVATPICATAPGMAMRFTAIKSRREKCSPTPNISNMTPISESCEAMVKSATTPGVAGPRMMPASKYPTSAGTRSRSAATPKASAMAKPPARVVTRERL